MQRAVCESTLGESKDLQGSSGTAIFYSGFLHWFWPMSDPRPMAPSFLKTLGAGVAPASAGEDNLARLEIAAKGRGLLGRFASPR